MDWLRQKELQSLEQHRKLWEGLEVGAVVVFDQSVTVQEYGCPLTTSTGEAICLDGVIREIKGNQAVVLIDRLVGRHGERGLLRSVRRDQIKEVSKSEAQYWGQGAELERAQNRRDKTAPAGVNPVYWEPSEWVPTS